MRCSTTSAPGFGPLISVRSHAYSGKSPNRRRVVRALLIRTARAAMGGTAPALLTRVCAGILASSQAGRMSARAFVASDERVVDLDCR
jgi:hypothetical protein